MMFDDSFANLIVGRSNIHSSMDASRQRLGYIECRWIDMDEPKLEECFHHKKWPANLESESRQGFCPLTAYDVAKFACQGLRDK